MSLIDVDYRWVCPKCGYYELSYIWDNIDKCPVCKTKTKKITLSQRLKLNKLNPNEIYDYIQEEIIKTTLEPNMVKLREEYQQKKAEEYLQRTSKCQQKEREKIQTYQAKYLEFLEEAQNQGIPRSRAEEIASYAMQHEMYSLPHCPSCGSVDANKISTGTKVAKTTAFGVYGAMSDSGKTWKCNKCGSKW